MPVRTQQHPIFERYSVGVLAKKLGITEARVVALKDGARPFGRRFRLNAALKLRKPESELFLPEAPAESK